MQKMSDQWIRPRSPGEAFPPYELADRDIVAQAEKRTRALGRIYHKSQTQSWDGPRILDELIERHGGICVPEDKKDALGRVAAILLWGELAAWSVSADIALRLEDVDAKMAASSQVFDEARHFHVLREYLWRAGVPIPELGGYSRTLLCGLLDTDNLLHKLVGMQLMVESAAVVLFKMIAEARIEPVLTDLLYYFERDEARHVGLGVLVLPRILEGMSDVDSARLWLYQLRIQLLMLGGGLSNREAFATLGVDQSEMQRYAFRLQSDVYRRMEAEGGARRGRGTRGLFRISRAGQARLNRFLFPGGARASSGPPRWQSTALRSLVGLAQRGDRLLARA